MAQRVLHGEERTVHHPLCVENDRRQRTESWHHSDPKPSTGQAVLYRRDQRQDAASEDANTQFLHPKRNPIVQLPASRTEGPMWNHH